MGMSVNFACSQALMFPYSDMYAIICEPTLLPTSHEDPAAYPAISPKKIDRESTIDDVCDFVVEYIDSDILVTGPLSASTCC